MTAASRGAVTYFRRNATGSSPAAAANSSMNCSLPNWICGPTGSRRCELLSSELASRSGGGTSHGSSVLSEAEGSAGGPETVVGVWGGGGANSQGGSVGGGFVVVVVVRRG